VKKYVRLILGKAKGVKFNPVNLKLDFDRRTFELCAAAPTPLTPYQQVVGVPEVPLAFSARAC